MSTFSICILDFALRSTTSKYIMLPEEYDDGDKAIEEADKLNPQYEAKVVKVVHTAGPKMEKKHCAGCYNNDYNFGLGGSKECWSFPSAKLIMRKEVHIDQVPPWNQEAKLLPSCYQRQRHVYVKPEQTC